MMTQTLERILFDVNEGLHRAGVIPDEKYITQEIVFFSLIVTAILFPLYMRFIESRLDDKNFILIIPVACMVLIYMMGGLFLVLLTMIMVGFMFIIFKYPQYRSVREFLEKFF